MKSFLTLLFFLIPLVWSRYVNANYLNTKTFFLYFTAALVLLALPTKLNFKKIPLQLLIPLGLIFIYYVGYFYFDSQASNWFYLFKMLSFASLTLYFYSLDLKLPELFNKISIPFLLMWLGILGITAYEVFNIRVLDQNIKTDVILSTFGNVNMFAEFLILILPLFFVWLRHKERIPELVKLVLFSGLIFFLLYTRSRSAWMGLMLWLGFQLFRGMSKKEYMAIGLALVVFAVSHFTAGDTTKISKLTNESFSERSSLYLASLELLRDNPTGIAVGQFMNEIVPYLIDKPASANEFAYFDQPHSEFLKWGIQFGWGFLALCLLFFIFLVIELIKRYRINDPVQKNESTFFIQSFLVLLPQMTFQFPFENPASILVISLVFGLFLSSYEFNKSLSIQYAQPLFGVMAFAGIVNAFIFITVVYFESAYPMSADMMNVACKTYPLNFKTCFWKNRGLLQMKNYQVFKNEFAKDFKANPFFCDNLRLLPEYFNSAQDAKKTCEALFLYKVIYKNQKHFLPEAFAQCSQFGLPFKFESGQQFARDFKKWFAD